MLFVNEHGIRERPGVPGCLNGFLGQIGLGRKILQRIDPRAGIFIAAGILGDGDDFKILVFQLLVDCLPAWQVKAASSP
jgi:hypothetical protein